MVLQLLLFCNRILIKIMDKESKTVTVSGKNISLDIRRRGTDKSWLFLHGWGADKRAWAQITGRLPFTTVAIDLPGFGRSQKLEKPWHVSDYTTVVSQLVVELDLPEVVLVGHSFGGQVAAALAANQPHWISGLVLVDAAVVRNQEPKALSVIGHFMAPIFRLPLLRQLRGPIYYLIGADRPPQNENLKKTMRNILHEDQSNNLSQIDAPTLVIWGDNDKDVPLSVGKFATNSIDQAKLIVLSGGHYVFLDSSKEFINKLVDFSNTLKQ